MAREPVPLSANSVTAARTEFATGQPNGEIVLAAARQGLLLGEGIEALDRLRRTLSTFRLQTTVRPSLVNQVAPATATRQALTNANRWARRANVLDDMLAVPGAWVAMSDAVATALHEGERLRLALTLAPKIGSPSGSDEDPNSWQWRRSRERRRSRCTAALCSRTTSSASRSHSRCSRRSTGRTEQGVKGGRGSTRSLARNPLVDEVADLLLEPIPRK